MLKVHRDQYKIQVIIMIQNFLENNQSIIAPNTIKIKTTQIKINNLILIVKTH